LFGKYYFNPKGTRVLNNRLMTGVKS